jgi:hypothetical protein
MNLCDFGAFEYTINTYMYIYNIKLTFEMPLIKFYEWTTIARLFFSLLYSIHINMRVLLQPKLHTRNTTHAPIFMHSTNNPSSLECAKSILQLQYFFNDKFKVWNENLKMTCDENCARWTWSSRESFVRIWINKKLVK